MEEGREGGRKMRNGKNYKLKPSASCTLPWALCITWGLCYNVDSDLVGLRPGWTGGRAAVFLTRSQGMPMLLAQGSHLDYGDPKLRIQLLLAHD